MKNPASHSIEYQQFNFKLTAKEHVVLPAYKGLTFRGGFGYAFKRVVCAIKDKKCSLLILVGYFADAVRIDFLSGNSKYLAYKRHNKIAYSKKAFRMFHRMRSSHKK